MAGYMKKLNGYVYEGGYEAAAELKNGQFVALNEDGKLALTDGAKDTIMTIVEKTNLYGLDAVVCRVTATGNDEVFFVENGIEVDEDNYNEAEYKIKAGELVRCHRPLIGEEMILSVENTLYAGLNASDAVQVAANGTIAAYSAD